MAVVRERSEGKKHVGSNPAAPSAEKKEWEWECSWAGGWQLDKVNHHHNR